MIADNISYVRNVLKDAVETRDVPDIEYLVTRLVSDVEHVGSQYNDWIYGQAQSVMMHQEMTAESDETWWEPTPAEFSVFDDAFQWNYQLDDTEVFEFRGPRAGSTCGSAA